MKSTLAIAALAFGAVHAHYTLPSINGGEPWSMVRKTANFQSKAPVTDVTSDAMRCYELAPGAGAPATAPIQAGATVRFDVEGNIFHAGPFSAWLAKVPAGQTAATYDGSGAAWFKIYQDHPTVSGSGGGSLTWPAVGKTAIDIPIPACVDDGEYLLRAEHLALHTPNAPQLYIACAQVAISGGSGGGKPDLVAIPGAYDPKDPGLDVNIYYPVPTNYKAPGPDPFTCGSTSTQRLRHRALRG